MRTHTSIHLGPEGLTGIEAFRHEDQGRGRACVRADRLAIHGDLTVIAANLRSMLAAVEALLPDPSEPCATDPCEACQARSERVEVQA